MDGKRIYLLARGYFFLLRSLIAGKAVNAALNLLAFLDYRILIFLSTWHPNNDARIRLLRKRGVNIGEHVFVDQATRIEVTAPKSVIIEDHVGIGYGAVIVAHDATASRVVDLPVRVKETRLRYGSGVGMCCVVLPGVEFGKFAHAMAGAVITKDIPADMVVSGNPAEVKCGMEDIGLAWQADVEQNPNIYYDRPNPWRPPSSHTTTCSPGARTA